MSVLRRKAQAGKKEYQVRSMTVRKALRVGTAKTANELFDFAMAVIGAKQESCETSKLADALDENDLFILLDGPAGLVGGAVMGAGLVSALVQQQTTGRVSRTLETRAFTETDASLCAPFLDKLFQTATVLLETDQDRLILGQYRFGSRAENQRLFELALEQPEYHVLRLTVDVAGGTLQSPLTLVLPLTEPAIAERSAKADEDVPPHTSAVTLEQNILGLKSELSAVLCEIALPLERVSILEVGDTLAIPPEAFDAVELLSKGGKKIATGALGQMEGQRAIMILDPLTKGTKEHASQTHGEEADIGPMESLDMPELGRMKPVAEVQAVSENIETVADLPDISDLAALPDLEQVGATGDAAMLADLPDLPDLPDLSQELPELGDLPKLNIA